MLPLTPPPVFPPPKSFAQLSHGMLEPKRYQLLMRPAGALLALIGTSALPTRIPRVAHVSTPNGHLSRRICVVHAPARMDYGTGQACMACAAEWLNSFTATQI